jgi:NAD(P)-dependent dehydrogenase (short-subunit alcohol dehydrogenase family)
MNGSPWVFSQTPTIRHANRGYEEQDLVTQDFALSEVERMIRDGEIKDATTVAALGLLRLKGLAVDPPDQTLAGCSTPRMVQVSRVLAPMSRIGRPGNSAEENSMADHSAPLLITGASRGIGEATARFFAQKGHRVALLARSVAVIESLANEIGGLAIPCDVADERAVRRSVQQAATKFGGIGIVINNAGTLEPAARILDTDPKDWTRNIEVNLFGPLYVLRHAVPLLPKGGVVINVSSGAAANPLVGWSAYSASKAGLSILTRILAIEESEARGIRVYGFLPGLVDTDMQAFNRANRINEVGNLKREVLRSVTEPAQIIRFLCSPEAADLNGQIVNARDRAIRIRAGVPVLSDGR